MDGVRISDEIAAYILHRLEQAEDGTAELQRNLLAEELGCVPSQISYVITSRFTPERGYMIESRRGGGGHIRIVRKEMHRDEYLMHFLPPSATKSVKTRRWPTCEISLITNWFRRVRQRLSRPRFRARRCKISHPRAVPPCAL